MLNIVHWIEKHVPHRVNHKKKPMTSNGSEASIKVPSNDDNVNLSSVVTQVTKDSVMTVPPVVPFEVAQQPCSGPTLLPPIAPHMQHRACLVLDLDETLVHASFTPVDHFDFTFPIVIKGKEYQMYVRKRPFMEEFLAAVAQKFEVVVFTASMTEYASEVLDLIDPTGVLIHHRLYRQHCTNTNGLFIKDLSLLGRPLERVVIVDNSPTAFLWHPRNAIQCTSWFDDAFDTELRDTIPLMDELAVAPDVVPVLDEFRQVASM
jgi:RNA polymerase II subunit A small phosphatase-like protein